MGGLRSCGFLRGVQTGGNECLSIGMAAWLTAHSSEAGAAANGAMATTAGAEGGKGKSARREKGRDIDKTGLDPRPTRIPRQCECGVRGTHRPGGARAAGTLQTRDGREIRDSRRG